MSRDAIEWQNFEDEVFKCVSEQLSAGKLGLDDRHAKVFLRKAYFSKDRDKDIIFDVALELYDPAHTSPLLIWLWECKDYPTRSVKVDEVEEFHAKMQQVGCHKGTILTRQGFEKGAVAYAKSKRIGLWTLKRSFIGKICLSQDSTSDFTPIIVVDGGISSDGTEIVHVRDQSSLLELYIGIEIRSFTATRG